MNKDGHTDIIFQHEDSTLAAWSMNGITTQKGELFTPQSSGVGWKVVAASDVNSDGNLEVIFQHADSTIEWREQLAQTPWICQGTVVCRPLLRQEGGRPVKKGPYYLWTCKVKGKTMCVALSQAQYHLLDQAIKNYHRLQKTLERMQALTLKTILRKVPGVKKRK